MLVVMGTFMYVIQGILCRQCFREARREEVLGAVFILRRFKFNEVM